VGLWEAHTLHSNDISGSSTANTGSTLVNRAGLLHCVCAAKPDEGYASEDCIFYHPLDIYCPNPI